MAKHILLRPGYWDNPSGRVIVPTFITDSSYPDPATEIGDSQYVEELQCCSCPDKSLSIGCLMC